MKKIVALLMALVMLCVAGAALADGTELSVRGTGVVYVTADKAMVVLGVREYSEDVRVAQATVNGKINAIYEALIAAGVESKFIATENISIYAEYDYSDYVERLAGYTASNSISIETTEIDKVGEYDLAFEAGANYLGGIDFMATDTKEAKNEALRLAVANAIDKAGVIAEAAGMEVKSINEIIESDEIYVSTEEAKFSNQRVMMDSAAGVSTLIQASTLEVTASVTINFELK